MSKKKERRGKDGVHTSTMTILTPDHVSDGLSAVSVTSGGTLLPLIAYATPLFPWVAADRSGRSS